MELGDGPLESHEQGLSNEPSYDLHLEVIEFDCEVRKVGVWILVFVWIAGLGFLPP